MVLLELRPPQRMRTVLLKVPFAPKDAHGRSVLLELLERHGIDTLLLAGCWTESCILSTVFRNSSETRASSSQ